MLVKKFGIELEIIAPINTIEMASKLRAKGIDVGCEGYNHSVSRRWKIVSDASVAGDSVNRYAMEVVSPILEGQAGLEEVEKILEALRDSGATVNKSCGMHVHHNAEDFTLQTMKNLIKIYWVAEEQIDSFMPRSRRGFAPQWIKSLKFFIGDKKAVWDTINNCKSIRDLSDEIYRGDRYFKLNIQSYFRQQSVEFRQHSGTIETDKVINWVKLTAGIVAEANWEGSIRSNYKASNVAKLAKDRVVTAFYKKRALELV